MVTRLENQIADLAIHDVAAQQRAHAPFQNEAVFILATVTVKRCSKRVRWHRVLDEREAPVGLARIDHEAHADGPE